MIDKNSVHSATKISRASIMYAVVSLIIKGEGLFENRYSPKNINSSGNNITRAKRFGTKEYDKTAYASLNLVVLI